MITTLFVESVSPLTWWWMGESTMNKHSRMTLYFGGILWIGHESLH